MRRRVEIWIVTAFSVSLPLQASADNCSSLSDCYGWIGAAVIAAVVIGLIGGAIFLIFAGEGIAEAIGIGIIDEIGVLETAVVEDAAVLEEIGAVQEKGLLKDAADLVKMNGGKQSVTIETATQKIRYDLAGKTHGGIPTPHMQIYNKNFVDGILKSITRASKEALPMTQKELDLVRNFLKGK